MLKKLLIYLRKMYIRNCNFNYDKIPLNIQYICVSLHKDIRSFYKYSFNDTNCRFNLFILPYI